MLHQQVVTAKITRFNCNLNMHCSLQITVLMLIHHNTLIGQLSLNMWYYAYTTFLGNIDIIIQHWPQSWDNLHIGHACRRENNHFDIRKLWFKPSMETNARYLLQGLLVGIHQRVGWQSRHALPHRKRISSQTIV